MKKSINIIVALKTFVLFCLILQFPIESLFAQFSDSLRITAGITTTLASEAYQPLWISSLQFGTITPEGADLSTHLLITNAHEFSLKKKKQAEENHTHNFYVRYGIDLYHNNHFQDLFTKEAYIKAGYKSWEIRAGQFQEIIGEVDPELSSGSLAVSGNALPLPKVGLAVRDYLDVPYTNGFLQFKGQYSHGWLGETHSVKNAFLHEKVLYVKVEKKRFNFYAGLMHFAQWGGEHERGPMPGRFQDYLRIIVGASGDPEDPLYQQGSWSIDVANAVGNHMINSDIGVQWRLDKSILKLYTQTIFCKGRGDSSNLNRRDDLIGLNMFGKDRMVGLSWTSNRKSRVEKVLLEGIYTKEQGGDIIFNGRFNYYNNATYATGWVHKEQVLGTPLFISRNQAAKYELDPSSTQGWNIVSNRLMGFHAGIKGSVNEKTSYRTLLTYMQHYGNYYNDSLFVPYKNQSNLLFEINHRLHAKILVTAAFALDKGELSNNKGGKLAVEWIVR